MGQKADTQHRVTAYRPDGQGLRDLTPELYGWRVLEGDAVGGLPITRRNLPVTRSEVEDDLHAAAGEYGVFKCHGAAGDIAVVAFDVSF